MRVMAARPVVFRPSRARWHDDQRGMEKEHTMDMLRRLFGGDGPQPRSERVMPRSRQMSPDEQAVDRYRYLLRTAPPETIEEAHAEAFSKLTPEQRRMVLQGLNSTLTPAEQAAGVNYDEDPRSLARLATRAEMRQPGTLERTWSGMPAGGGMGGMGMGGFMMGNFMSTIAGVFIGSAIADAFLGNSGYDQGYADGTDASAADASGAEGDDFGGDAGAGDGGAFGDFGGDVGGDFGGFGDFGGGEF
jgi:hypothetical protein